ncbi:MAG: 30S ribosomal protein S17 [Spirochaetales bacterium]|uniref:Small ribosomal subunit protein uS17 n=1 Tax=Candidatus Thalassospirochaeta sargassi TaxID=3119039 RepID=A0AAJ1ILD6_9SPIO|nr:30S ribosomal protein S17 [Spirochaetales bacterium]
MDANAVERTKGYNKTYTGVVVSDKMDKTIVVQVNTRKLHKLYKKYLARSKKLKAHDEKNEANIGDTVRVIESRPISKDKCWRLVEIVERAK